MPLYHEEEFPGCGIHEVDHVPMALPKGSLVDENTLELRLVPLGLGLLHIVRHHSPEAGVVLSQKFTSSRNGHLPLPCNILTFDFLLVFTADGWLLPPSGPAFWQVS